MATFPPPPTYAEPVIVDDKTGKAGFSPIWLNWFLAFAKLLEDAASGTIIEHNNLLSIQGGTPGQYYHFTSAEHTTLAAYNHESLNGLLGGTASQHYHLTSAQHTLITPYQHNSLNALDGGTAGQYYHFTSAQHTLLVAYQHNSLNAIDGTGNYHVSSAEASTLTDLNTDKVIPLRSGAADPTTSDVASGKCVVYKNTSSGEIRLWVNDSGSMKKSAALT